MSNLSKLKNLRKQKAKNPAPNMEYEEAVFSAAALLLQMSFNDIIDAGGSCTLTGVKELGDDTWSAFFSLSPPSSYAGLSIKSKPLTDAVMMTNDDGVMRLYKSDYLDNLIAAVMSESRMAFYARIRDLSYRQFPIRVYQAVHRWELKLDTDCDRLIAHVHHTTSVGTTASEVSVELVDGSLPKGWMRKLKVGIQDFLDTKIAHEALGLLLEEM